MEDNAECMLVLIGATPEGKKELVGFQIGVRESAQSWRELLIDIKQRGLEIAPDLAVRDGALGFWKAIEEVFPSTRHQRCWVHKTANILNKVARSVQVNMKADLREIYGAPTRAAAEMAINVFADKYGAKYDKAVACLTKDKETLLAFFDFPAEHWDHLRTSNPIESVFATVRHRTVRTKGALSAKTAKLMVFKLVNAAAKTCRRLKGENQLPKVVQGHCCPAILLMARGKSLVENRKKDFLGVTDLNLDLGDWGFSALVIPNVRRQTCFRATDGFSSVAHISSLRRALPVELPHKNVLPSGSISVHGLRAIDLPREPA
jgi:hypothetical protein